MKEMSTWLYRAKNNLLPLSREKKDFFKAKTEWIYVGLEDTETAESTCELCEQENLRYEYTIKNKYNFNEMIVGSSCIEKFIAELNTTENNLLDTEGLVVSKERLKSDKEKYWEKILFKILDEKFNTKGFEQDITNHIKNRDSISIKQAICLQKLYRNLNDNEKSAFRNLVKINLRKNYFKNQYYELKFERDLKFIEMLLSSQQKKLLERDRQ
ncbi:hypothetical protein IGJ77_003044 [Enterococcus sp. AZ147]